MMIGTRRFSKERILKSVESVLKTRNINRLTQEAYEFITSYCGSAPHYNANAWKRAYADVRDFVNLFLKSNEYGVNLERAVIVKKKEANRSQELPVIKGIVELCREHRDQVFKDLGLEEGKERIRISRGLARGTISLKDILGGKGVAASSSPSRSLHNYMTGMDSANIRELVEELNRLIDRMNVAGIKELVKKYPKESVVAGNYVDSKVRYVVQAIIAAEVSQLKPALE
jgi:hypothetical protein